MHVATKFYTDVIPYRVNLTNCIRNGIKGKMWVQNGLFPLVKSSLFVSRIKVSGVPTESEKVRSSQVNIRIVTRKRGTSL